MRLTHGGWALVVWSTGLLAWLAPGAPRLVSELAGPSFTDALLALGTLVVLVLAGWVVMVAVLVLAGASSRLVRAVTPGLLRHALLAGAAGALAIGPAHAEQGVGVDTRSQHSVSGLQLPDRPDAGPGRVLEPRTFPPRAPETRAPETHAPETTEPRAVEVKPGDTLWAIAARSLPDDAGDAQIAAATRAWHAANRRVIGADPHRIFPAQRLVPPTGKDHP